MGEWVLTRVVVWDTLEQTKFYDGVSDDIKCPYCLSMFVSLLLFMTGSCVYVV